jgi:heme exporter protein CcmD
MDWSAKHAGFVIASYLLSAGGIAGLIAYVFLRDRQLRHKLHAIEKASKP